MLSQLVESSIISPGKNDLMDRRRVLIVDDPNVVRVMKRGLVYASYAVDEASTGEAALELARDRSPDLVILDVMLPGLDGLEVCRRLRVLRPGLPILLLTARDRVPDRVAGLDAGAVGLIEMVVARRRRAARVAA